MFLLFTLTDRTNLENNVPDLAESLEELLHVPLPAVVRDVADVDLVISHVACCDLRLEDISRLRRRQEAECQVKMRGERPGCDIIPSVAGPVSPHRDTLHLY